MQPLARYPSSPLNSRPMKSRLLVLLVALTFSIGALAQQPKTSDNALAPIEWLVGDWHATATSPEGKSVRVDNHIYWSETHTAIFFVTRFDGKPHYSGMYAYDPGTKQIGFWYVDTDGNFTQGTTRAEGTKLIQDFATAKAEGTKQELHSSIERKTDGNSYHWQVWRDDPSKILIQLDYVKK